MRNLVGVLAALLLVAGVANQQAAAGTIQWGVEVVSAFDPNTFDPVPIPPLDQNQPAPVGLELGLSFTPTPDVGERDFLNFALDLGLSGDLTDPGFGYIASPSPMVDTSPAPGDQLGPVFPTNQDAGAADLQDIILSKTAPLTDTDNRTTYNGYPLKFGTVFLTWGGQQALLTLSGEASFNLPGGTAIPEARPFEPFEFRLGQDDVQPVVTGAIDPAVDLGEDMISMQGAFDDGTGVVLGAIAVSTDIPVDDLQILDLLIGPISGMESAHYAGLYGASVGSNDGATASIDLSMDLALATSLPNGTFAASELTIVTNYGDLVYQLKATVPEPSTVALAGLGLIGLVGFARRRVG